MGNHCWNFRRSPSPNGQNPSKNSVVPQNSAIMHQSTFLFRSQTARSEIGLGDKNSKKKNIQSAKSFHQKNFEEMTEKDFIESYFPIYGVFVVSLFWITCN